MWRLMGTTRALPGRVGEKVGVQGLKQLEAVWALGLALMGSEGARQIRAEVGCSGAKLCWCAPGAE